MQREDGAKKVRRGMAGVVRAGRYVGGRCYGYRSVPGRPGELEIVACEAEIVRRIFAEYVAGRPPREIARDLNSEAIPPPRGVRWCKSGMSVTDTDRKGIRIRCTAFSESRSCTNSRRYYLKDIERLVIGGMREHLRDPQLIETYVRTYNEERRRLAMTSASSRTKLERRLAANEGERQRIVERVGKGTIEDDDAKAD
jgi:hypothetical protein